MSAVSAPPLIGLGEEWAGYLDVLPGEAPPVPCKVVRGARPGPTLVVTAGIHGAEYASIAAAQRLAEVRSGELHGTLIVVPVVNTAAYFARSIYVNPVDGKNLNRVFPGRPDGTASERLAHWLVSELLLGADAFVDLHGGDLVEALVPFSVHQSGATDAAALAEAFSLDYRIASAGEGTTTAAAHAAGVTAVLAEAGGQGLWPESAVGALVDATRRGMELLGMITGAPSSKTASVEVSRLAWSYAEFSGCWYPAVRAGDSVVSGQELGRITDLLGNVLQVATSEVAGTALFSVSSMAINLRDPLVGIGAS